MVDNPSISIELAGEPIAKFMTRSVRFTMVNATARSAIETMITHKISGLPVINQSEQVVGVYSELDAMLQLASQGIDAVIKFSSPLHSVKQNTPFKDVLLLVAKNRIKRVPVVDGTGRLVGVVSRRDMMKALFEDSKVAFAAAEAKKNAKKAPKK
jgi:CBS domain-containing protein